MSSASLFRRESEFVYQQFRFLFCEVLILFTSFTLCATLSEVPQGAAGLLGCLPLIPGVSPGVLYLCLALVGLFEAGSFFSAFAPSILMGGLPPGIPSPPTLTLAYVWPRLQTFSAAGVVRVSSHERR